jgi:hypothetical protein
MKYTRSRESQSCWLSAWLSTPLPSRVQHAGSRPQKGGGVPRWPLQNRRGRCPEAPLASIAGQPDVLGRFERHKSPHSSSLSLPAVRTLAHRVECYGIGSPWTRLLLPTKGTIHVPFAAASCDVVAAAARTGVVGLAPYTRRTQQQRQHQLVGMRQDHFSLLNFWPQRFGGLISFSRESLSVSAVSKSPLLEGRYFALLAFGRVKPVQSIYRCLELVGIAFIRREIELSVVILQFGH